MVEKERESLRWRGEHDRLLRQIARGPLAGAVEVVSAAIVAQTSLGQRARLGLVEMLRRMSISGQDVQELEVMASNSDVPVP